MSHKGVHLVPAVKMPNDPKNLVHNEEEEKEWTEEEQQILEEKLLVDGNNISTVLRLVGLLQNRTIQQITMRANWTLLSESEKVPYEVYKKSQMKTETQIVVPNSAKVYEIKKKKPRQRHSSVIEETQTQKMAKQRRLSMTKEGKGFVQSKTGLTVEYQPLMSDERSYNSLVASGLISPRFVPLSPSGNMSYDGSSISTEYTGIDIAHLDVMIMENEQYIQMIQNATLSNIQLPSDIIFSFVNNMEKLMTVTQQLSYPYPLPFFSLNLNLPQQFKDMHVKEIIQTPLQLNWNFPL